MPATTNPRAPRSFTAAGIRSLRYSRSGSECETILKSAGGVFGDKGFIGPDYITTPVRKPQDRDLYIREHDYNNQVSSFRAPVERAIADLKTWRILFTDYRRPLRTFLCSFRAAIGLYFFKLGFA